MSSTAHRGKDTNIEIVALNDSGGVKQAGHLLKYDTVLGTFDADVKVSCAECLLLCGWVAKHRARHVNLIWGSGFCLTHQVLIQELACRNCPTLQDRDRQL